MQAFLAFGGTPYDFPAVDPLPCPLTLTTFLASQILQFPLAGSSRRLCFHERKVNHQVGRSGQQTHITVPSRQDHTVFLPGTIMTNMVKQPPASQARKVRSRFL